MTRPPDPPRHNTPGVIWAKQPGQFDDGGGGGGGILLSEIVVYIPVGPPYVTWFPQVANPEYDPLGVSWGADRGSWDGESVTAPFVSRDFHPAVVDDSDWSGGVRIPDFIATFGYGTITSTVEGTINDVGSATSLAIALLDMRSLVEFTVVSDVWNTFFGERVHKEMFIPSSAASTSTTISFDASVHIGPDWDGGDVGWVHFWSGRAAIASTVRVPQLRNRVTFYPDAV